MKKENEERYVDGFVLVVPEENVADYRKMAEEGAEIWMRCGALDYKECMGDDLSPDMGGMPVFTFTEMAKAKEGETVWFSFITFKSREHRDEVNKKVMAEMHTHAEKHKDMKMPFDMKRMAYGGFKVIVQA